MLNIIDLNQYQIIDWSSNQLLNNKIFALCQ